MKRRQKAEVLENISPNLIPMIDIMFLLLLFFMLSADMTQREMEDLVLPVASAVDKTEEEKTVGEENTIVNIHHAPDGNAACAVYANGGACREPGHWKWAIRGKDYDKDTLKEQLAVEAQLNMESAPDPLAKKLLSARKVLIRADSRAPFGDVQKVVEYCGVVGIYKVEVAAAAPPEDKG